MRGFFLGETPIKMIATKLLFVCYKNPRGALSSMKLRTTKTVTAVTELLVFGRFGKISPNLPKYFGCRNNEN